MFLKIPGSEEIISSGYILSILLCELRYSPALLMATGFCSETQSKGFLINSILTEDT